MSNYTKWTIADRIKRLEAMPERKGFADKWQYTSNREMPSSAHEDTHPIIVSNISQIWRHNRSN